MYFISLFQSTFAIELLCFCYASDMNICIRKPSLIHQIFIFKLHIAAELQILYTPSISFFISNDSQTRVCTLLDVVVHFTLIMHQTMHFIEFCVCVSDIAALTTQTTQLLSVHMETYMKLVLCEILFILVRKNFLR